VLAQTEQATRSATVIDLRPDSRPSARVEEDRAIRVLVADESRLTAETLMFAFGTNERLEPVGYALDGWEAVELATALEPDVIVVGPELDGLDSLSFVRLAHRIWPRMRIVLLADEHSLEAGEAHSVGSAELVSSAHSAGDLMQTIEEAGALEAAYERIGTDAALLAGLVA